MGRLSVLHEGCAITRLLYIPSLGRETRKDTIRCVITSLLNIPSLTPPKKLHHYRNIHLSHPPFRITNFLKIVKNKILVKPEIKILRGAVKCI